MLTGKVQKDKPEMPCEKQADGVRIREKAMNVLVGYACFSNWHRNLPIELQ